MTKDSIAIPAEHLTTNYVDNPVSFSQTYYISENTVYGHNFPIWSLTYVPVMLRDSRVNYGLKLIKGPIQAFTIFLPEKDADDEAVHETIREQGIQFVYKVKSESTEVAEFVLNTLNQFWVNGLEDYLTKLDWGFSCSQVIYKLEVPGDYKTIEYDQLSWYHPSKVRPLVKNNNFIGVEVNPEDGSNNEYRLYGPKVLWGVHNQRVNKYWGQSLLFDTFVPFHEQWTPFGARDIRRTWFHKNSFDGGEVRYPIGKTVLPDGTTIDNMMLALKLLGQIRTGGGRALPSEVDQNGKPKWEYIPPMANITPQGLMEYPEALRIEILEGLGIPPEVVESSSDNGMGGATGRKIPMTVYYSTLGGIANKSIITFDKQVLKYLVRIRFGDVKYAVERVIPLKSQTEQADALTKTVNDTGLSN